METVKGALLDIFTLLLSIVLSIYLLENAGLDATTAFGITSGNFSISVGLLFFISIYTIDSLSKKLVIYIAGFFGKSIIGG